MYENETFDVILQRMLNRVSDSCDKRKGSIIYDAVAPIAGELAQAYMELDNTYELTFAATTNDNWLDLRLEESGVKRNLATKAIRKGVFNIDVPIGSRFRGENVIYEVKEKIELGVFRLEAETAGTIGNEYFGQILPISNIDNLTSAELDEVLIPGENRETDEAYYTRYLEEINADSYGGNVDQYKEWIKDKNLIQGVGRFKIVPLWNGRGTVKAIITDINNGVPSSELVESVQMAIDPFQDGKGNGLAPIGHVFTAAGAVSRIIDFEFSIEFKQGFGSADVETEINAIVDEYLKDINLSSPDEIVDDKPTVVRRIVIKGRVVALDQIEDIEECLINGLAENLTLEDDEIAVRGAVVINVHVSN